MSINGRPALKLKLNTGAAAGAAGAPIQPPTPSERTPGGTMKIKLTNRAASTPTGDASSSAAASAATDQPKKRKPAKKAKVGNKDAPADPAPAPAKKGKKRQAEGDGGRPAKQGTGPTGLKIRLPSTSSTSTVAKPGSAVAPGLQRRQTIKLKAKQSPSLATPQLRIKAKGHPPKRPVGVGYDSEASDVEDDPAIENQFVLRMIPGEDCDYLRNAIAEKRIGLPLKEGGADVQLKFFDKEGRRALVTIQGRMYAACLVDLPCIIEGMKSWDKKAWFKSGDICQMLLVLGRCEGEKAAQEYPLSRDIDKLNSYQYPHGLTPPMHYVRKRRFRKRVSYRTIEAVEDAVEKLLAADERAISNGGNSNYRVVDLEEERRREEGLDDAEYDQGDYGALQEDSYFDGVEADEDFTRMFEEQLEQDEDDAATTAVTPFPPTPADTQSQHLPDSSVATHILHGLSSSAAASPAGMELVETPAAVTTDADDDDDDDDDAIDDLDEEALAAQQQRQQEEEEIADLEREVENARKQLEAQRNPLLKARLQQKVQSLMADLELKKGGGGGAGWDE